MSRQCSQPRIAAMIRRALKQGHTVEIAGLGTFRPLATGFEFLPDELPRIFLAYVKEDLLLVHRLFKDLERAGYRPWLDKESLLPGQNWPRSIRRAIDSADFFIPCFSKRSVLKRGGFQSELRFALECAAKLPLEDVFLIPIRLNDCEVPEQIHNQLHYVDLFPSWRDGIARICRTVDQETARKRRLKLPRAS